LTAARAGSAERPLVQARASPALALERIEPLRALDQERACVPPSAGW
jgi:hypothetical protein